MADQTAHLIDVHVVKRMEASRHLQGLTQSDLAKALGISFQQVQKYEKGVNRVSASKLWQASEFLGVEVGYFFEGLTRSTKPAHDRS